MKIILCSGTVLRTKARAVYKTILIMKFIVILLALTCFKVNAKLYAQITLNVKDAPIPTVLKQIKKQSGYQFFYDENIFNPASTLTVNLKNADIQTALEKCFADLPYTYQLIDRTIVIKRKSGIAERITNVLKDITVSGQVTDAGGRPIAGVTVSLKGGKTLALTDTEGKYRINVAENAVLVFSYIGFATQEVNVNNIATHNIRLTEAVGQLDETVIRGYGTTTQRLNTGNIGVVKAASLSDQPISNPLQGVIGQVSGVDVRQTNGLPGAAFTIRIRGTNSIGASNEPLYIVDGVPFSSDGLAGLRTFVNVSPLNSINLNDVESISILKDADATAVYGSRGANGVVLITTKKGQIGKTKLEVNLNNSYGSVTRTIKPLSTAQYLQLRRDAFTNSGIVPTASNAPDLMVWDQNTDNNLQDWYLGNTAKIWDSSAAISGGSEQLTFAASGSFRQENTVRSSSDNFKRGNFHVNVGYTSENKKFSLGLSAFFSSNTEKLSNKAQATLSNIGTSVPNYPLYDSNGKFNWVSNLENYVALSTAYWKSNTNMLNGNLDLKYQIIKGLYIKSSLGYNLTNNDTMTPSPSTAINPISSIKSITGFASTKRNSLIFEPQLLYNSQFKNTHIDFLIGSTIQKNQSFSNIFTIQNYINDLLIESQNGGTVLGGVTSNSINYRYLSFFGRVSFNHNNKYLINGTFRRDGSTRFGPGKQFGNFGSIGAGWLFTNEDWIKNNIQWLSYGKLRGSWGTTGSDGIGDYGYLSIYSTLNDYGTAKAIYASQIANKDFQWEVNKKLEFGLELGFIKDRVLLTTAWYRNRSGNQLVTYPLPSTTGFTGYIGNLPALVQNTGWEFELTSRNISRSNFKWDSSFNLTIPKNKLVEFPNIELTSYANTLVIGQSLNTVLLYHYLGIDPQTGLTQIEDINNDGQFTPRSRYNGQNGDYDIAGTTDPKWYAGLNNSFSYKGFKLGLFFQYINQKAYNLYSNMFLFSNFGGLSNFWVNHLDYWKQPGDQSALPKPFATFNQSSSRFSTSEKAFSDASFLRLNNISLSYSLAGERVSKIGLKGLSIYLQGQNVFTITKYNGYDPSAPYNIPNLKVWNLGLKAIL